MKLALWISTAVFALGASGHGALADAGHSHDDQYKMLQKMQEMHSGHGREVFLEKGCIVRHCVNGASGEVGLSLNAADMPEPMNAFEFAARRWRGAPVMTEMQRDLLGAMVGLNGQDLADIIAFTHDEAEQQELSITQVPEEYRDLIGQ